MTPGILATISLYVSLLLIVTRGTKSFLRRILFLIGYVLHLACNILPIVSVYYFFAQKNDLQALYVAFSCLVLLFVGSILFRECVIYTEEEQRYEK